GGRPASRRTAAQEVTRADRVRPSGARTDPTAAEIIAASLCSFLATATIAAYLAYRAGLRVAPLAVLVPSLLVPSAMIVDVRRPLSWREPEVSALSIVLLAVFTTIEWQSRPSFLPVGGGQDLTPHMVLINYIQEHWQLVPDPGLVAYLGDMIHYTPG